MKGVRVISWSSHRLSDQEVCWLCGSNRSLRFEPVISTALSPEDSEKGCVWTSAALPAAADAAAAFLLHRRGAVKSKRKSKLCAAKASVVP